MNRKDIIRWAREARLGSALTHDGEQRVWIEGADWHDELDRFAALVAAAAKAEEREACIEDCEALGDSWRQGYLDGVKSCIAVIRARGQQ